MKIQLPKSISVMFLKSGDTTKVRFSRVFKAHEEQTANIKIVGELDIQLIKNAKTQRQFLWLPFCSDCGLKTSIDRVVSGLVKRRSILLRLIGIGYKVRKVLYATLAELLKSGKVVVVRYQKRLLRKLLLDFKSTEYENREKYVFLVFKVGASHETLFIIPPLITCDQEYVSAVTVTTPKNQHLRLISTNSVILGNTVARILELRKPNLYSRKGIYNVARSPVFSFKFGKKTKK